MLGHEGVERQLQMFTRSELTALLETAEREMPAAYPVALTLARAGLRIGEALTLQVGDLDFERHGLWARRTWGSRKKALALDASMLRRARSLAAWT
jgi:integrase